MNQHVATAIIVGGVPLLFVGAKLIAPYLQKLWSHKEFNSQLVTHQNELHTEKRPVLTFWWEWNSLSPFWPANEAAYNRFGYGEVNPEELGLPPDLISDLISTAAWHDSSLNWDYPPDPGPWRQAECDQFNAKSKELFALCHTVLEPNIVLIYKHGDEKEDPDLDRYLTYPKSFKRDTA